VYTAAVALALGHERAQPGPLLVHKPIDVWSGPGKRLSLRISKILRPSRMFTSGGPAVGQETAAGIWPLIIRCR
jgi:hypothetical protein